MRRTLWVCYTRQRGISHMSGIQTLLPTHPRPNHPSNILPPPFSSPVSEILPRNHPLLSPTSHRVLRRRVVHGTMLTSRCGNCVINKVELLNPYYSIPSCLISRKFSSFYFNMLVISFFKFLSIDIQSHNDNALSYISIQMQLVHFSVLYWYATLLRSCTYTRHAARQQRENTPRQSEKYATC